MTHMPSYDKSCSLFFIITVFSKCPSESVLVIMPVLCSCCADHNADDENSISIAIQCILEKSLPLMEVFFMGLFNYKTLSVELIIARVYELTVIFQSNF